MNIQAIVTAPPYASFLEEVAHHRIVSGLRLNTVMPLKEEKVDALKRLQSYGRPVWVDLKGRQLRVIGAAIPPYTEVILSHPIEVETPTDAFFSDGNELVRIAAVDGNRLILEDGPRRLIGPGESVNIPHPSLKILGTLTDTDRDYLAAMKSIGMNKVMLSYVESPEDVAEIQSLLPGAEVVLKIETLPGLAFSRKYGTEHGRLMAARGDLFVEVIRPHKVISALSTIIKADPEAMVASRLFDSLAYQPIPESADIGDVAFLLSLGYRTFMFGDRICFQRDSIMEGLNLLAAVAREFN
ncbi:MAG: pyruvate kinase [Candidatus Promineifilaceae bacterium]